MVLNKKLLDQDFKACNSATFLKKYLPSILQESANFLQNEAPIYTCSSGK